MGAVFSLTTMPLNKRQKTLLTGQTKQLRDLIYLSLKMYWLLCIIMLPVLMANYALKDSQISQIELQQDLLND